MDSDDSRWAVRVDGPMVDDMGPISGEWIAAQGLPVPSLLVGQAVLIEGVEYDLARLRPGRGEHHG